MGHYASEMGHYSRRNVSWLSWGFKSLYLGKDLLVCPLCFATVPEELINISYGNNPDEYRLPWMEHIFWHEEVQRDGSTFGWHFPISKQVTDKKEAWMLGEMKRAYRESNKLPADFLEEWYSRQS